MTPFEKYFQDTDCSSYRNPSQDAYDVNSVNRVQFQMPHFMYTGPPTLAPGGGAEVLPVGMFNSNDSLAAAWFTNNHGFSPDEAYLSSSLRSCMPFGQYRNVVEPQISILPDVDSHHYDFTGSLVSQPAPLPPPPQTTSHNDNNAQQSEARDQLSLNERNLMAIGEATGLSAPSPLGLPVYSATGFDVLSILARVATRPNPRVVLGPVDLTCSFVVVDVRRHDHPIVYCSPTFCRLTGYSEAEVLGRNCRFLQCPDGQVQKGDQRRFTSQEAVAHLKKNLLADKECQTSIVNYRKGGRAFINLVTVIPIIGGGSPYEENEVVYHVGFQVDLSEQPNVILQKLRDGSYAVNHSSDNALTNSSGSPLGGSGALGTTGGSKKAQISQPLISKELKKLLADADFVQSIAISSSTTVPPLAASSADKADNSTDCSHWLSLMLLESCPDFLHVVSLKGNFLYVAPSVRRVLGYEPEEMVGGSIADFSHPEDIVPLMRELKESSSTGGASPGVSSMTQDGQQPAQISIAPRTVDLLFRARTKLGTYVWVECRGRLHVEPGKGRKAIILSGRAREMPRLGWDVVRKTGGLARNVEGDEGKRQEQEFWSMLGGQGTFIVVGTAIKDVLGWESADLAGRYVWSLLAYDDTSELESEVKRMQWEEGQKAANAAGQNMPPREKKSSFVRLRSRLRRADGGSVDAMVVLYRPLRDAVVDTSPMPAKCISPSPIMCQIKLDDSPRIGSGISTSMARRSDSLPSSVSSSGTPSISVHRAESNNVFEELETSRGSSWQYELQQLKFANQRLEDEVCFLEAQMRAREGVQGQLDDEHLHQQVQVQQNLYASQPQPQSTEQATSAVAAAAAYPTVEQTLPHGHHHLTHTQIPQSASDTSASSSLQVLSSPMCRPPSLQPPTYAGHNGQVQVQAHERSMAHTQQQQRRHSHQTSQSQYSAPAQFNNIHTTHNHQHNVHQLHSHAHTHPQHTHQRQQSYPPYTGHHHHHQPYSHHMTTLKRTWDIAQT